MGTQAGSQTYKRSTNTYLLYWTKDDSFSFYWSLETKKGDPSFALSLRHSKLGPLSNFPFAFLGSTSCRPEAAGAEKFFAIKLDNALLLLSSLLVLSNAYTHTMRLHLNASLSSEYP